MSVSYTHLDVYKRQVLNMVEMQYALIINMFLAVLCAWLEENSNQLGRTGETVESAFGENIGCQTSATSV